MLYSLEFLLAYLCCVLGVGGRENLCSRRECGGRGEFALGEGRDILGEGEGNICVERARKGCGGR